MFGLGFGELVVIVIVALVLIGPKQLPHVMKGVAKMMKHVQDARNDLRSAVEGDETIRSMRDDVDEIKNRLEEEAGKLRRELEASEDTEVLDARDLSQLKHRKSDEP